MGQDDDKGPRSGAAWRWWPGFGHFVCSVWATFVLILMIHPGILPTFKRCSPDGHWVALVVIHPPCGETGPD